MILVENDLSRRLPHLDFYKTTDNNVTTVDGTSDYTKPSGLVTPLSLTATVGTEERFSSMSARNHSSISIGRTSA